MLRGRVGRAAPPGLCSYWAGALTAFFTAQGMARSWSLNINKVLNFEQYT